MGKSLDLALLPPVQLTLSETRYMAQVREYEFNAEQRKENEKNADKLRTEVETKRSQLEEWSSTAYGEVCSFPLSSPQYSSP